MKRIVTVSEMASLGGKARAKSLTVEQLSEQGRRAVQARWEKYRAAKAASGGAGPVSKRRKKTGANA
jgi:hypothetical protein